MLTALLDAKSIASCSSGSTTNTQSEFKSCSLDLPLAQSTFINISKPTVFDVGVLVNRLWIGEVIKSSRALNFFFGMLVLDFYSTLVGEFNVSIVGLTMVRLWGCDLIDLVSLGCLLPYLEN